MVKNLNLSHLVMSAKKISHPGNISNTYHWTLMYCCTRHIAPYICTEVQIFRVQFLYHKSKIPATYHKDIRKKKYFLKRSRSPKVLEYYCKRHNHNSLIMRRENQRPVTKIFEKKYLLSLFFCCPLFSVLFSTDLNYGSIYQMRNRPNEYTRSYNGLDDFSKLFVTIFALALSITTEKMTSRPKQGMRPSRTSWRQLAGGHYLQLAWDRHEPAYCRFAWGCHEPANCNSSSL